MGWWRDRSDRLLERGGDLIQIRNTNIFSLPLGLLSLLLLDESLIPCEFSENHILVSIPFELLYEQVVGRCQGVVFIVLDLLGGVYDSENKLMSRERNVQFRVGRSVNL